MFAQKSWLRSALFSGLACLTVVFADPTTVYASPYQVPESGLSFDANDTVENNPCTTGYGNSGNAETDEVSGLAFTDSLTYRNVATIGGQAIDAKVTLTSISTGMQDDNDTASRLTRLDKCSNIPEEAGLLEIAFESTTAFPGEENFAVKIDFFEGGTSTAATLTNLKMNVEDIDWNQYMQVDDFSSIRLAPDRSSTDVQEYENGDTIDLGGGNSDNVVISATARRFHATGGSSSSDPQEEQDKHVVEVTYASTSSITITLGVYDSGGGSFDLNFQGFEFQSDTAPSSSESDADDESPVSGPAIALTPLFSEGEKACGREISISGYGLKIGSTASLTMHSPSRTLFNRTLEGQGLEEAVLLPASIPAGTYQLAMSATSESNQALDLVRTFSVNAECVVTALDEGVAGVVGTAGLARTGGAVPVSLTALALGLVAAGVIGVRYGRKSLASQVSG